VLWKEIQMALWDVISGDSRLEELCDNRFYPTEVPSKVPYPFIASIDNKGATPWKTLGQTTEGAIVTWPLRVHARDGGVEANENIIARLYELFHLQSFEIDKAKVVSSEITMDSGSYPDPDLEDGYKIWNHDIMLTIRLRKED